MTVEAGTRAEAHLECREYGISAFESQMLAAEVLGYIFEYQDKGGVKEAGDPTNGPG